MTTTDAANLLRDELTTLIFMAEVGEGAGEDGNLIDPELVRDALRTYDQRRRQARID